MAVIEEVLIGLGWKVDSKGLQKADRDARESARKAEDAWAKASLKVQQAQGMLANAASKSAKARAREELKLAKIREKMAKGAVEEARDAAKAAAKAIVDAGKESKKQAGSVAKAWGKAKGVVAGALLGAPLAAAGGVAAFGKHVIDNARDLDTWRQRIGATTEELQALEIASEKYNIENKEVREGIKTFRENLGELARIGTGPAKDALGTLGVKLEDIKDLKVEDQLALFGDALNELPDQGERLSVAIEIMGEEGARLLPVLQEGSAGIHELADAARDSGRIMSTEMVDKTIEVDREWKKTRGTLDASATTIAASLLPVMSDSAEGMTKWIAENDDLIKQDLPEVFESIAKAAGVMAEAIGGVIGFVADLGRAAGDLGDKLGGETIQLQLAWSVVTGQISYEAAQAVSAGLGEVSKRGAPALESAAPEPQGPSGEEVLSGLVASNQAFLDRRKRAAKFRKDELKKASGGGRGKKVDKELAEALARVRLDGLGDELRRLGVSAGASDKAIDEALKSAAEQYKKGASKAVGRKAGVGTLSSLTGVDLAKRGKDPLLSAIFGMDHIPDVPLSEIEQGQQPQVLISHVNNNYQVTINNDIDGSRDPIRVADDVEQRFRTVLKDELSRVSKFSKVLFAR